MLNIHLIRAKTLFTIYYSMIILIETLCMQCYSDKPNAKCMILYYILNS